MTSIGTLPLGRLSAELRFEGYSLTVIEGPDAGATLRATTSEVSIGTAEGSDLVLSDPTVSRHHCSVEATSNGLLLTDLGSSNGTIVNGVRVERGFVTDGVRLRIGRTTLRLDVLDEEICEPLSREERFGPLLGTSTVMRRIFAALPKIAESDSTVLLEGETGTGKGVLAEAIHDASPRRGRPFVVIDCGAIAPTLVESELFGHVKGSFTGASHDRPGAFESAAGGTVFLDEIGELPLDMQPKLLRALEERTVKRLGASQRVKLDVRVIAATNRDLRTEVNRGAFRVDLFYRLNIVRLHIPPLRDRGGDIERLARHFHEELAPHRPLEDAVLDKLRRQTWPGNVRELRSAVERTLLLDDPELLALGESSTSSSGRAVGDEPAFDPQVPFRVAKQRSADRWERVFVRELLEASKGNLSEAARMARMDRSHLRDLLKKHGVRGSDEAAGDG